MPNWRKEFFIMECALNGGKAEALPGGVRACVRCSIPAKLCEMGLYAYLTLATPNIYYPSPARDACSAFMLVAISARAPNYG